jgi:hypothetical protein
VVINASNAVVADHETEDTFLAGFDDILGDHTTGWRESIAANIRKALLKYLVKLENKRSKIIEESV